MLTALTELRIAVTEDGPKYAATRAIERILFRNSPLPASVFWPLASRFFAQTLETDTQEYEAPLNPVAVRYVNPNRIRIVTGRTYPAWNNLRASLGRVQSGDWDHPMPIEDLSIVADYDGTPAEIYYAPRFEETPMHNALVARFEEGKNWEEISLIQEFLDSVEGMSGHLWNGCQTPSDIKTRCAKLDQVYKEIRDNGYRMQIDLAQENNQSLDYLDLLGEEVRIDLARDGEPRFVAGRHRLSMAKILGLEAIPVVVCVRHADWMTHRDTAFQNKQSNHFDYEW